MSTSTHPIDSPTHRALLIVDVQPTFCEGGSLPVPGGNDVAHAVASYASLNRDHYDTLVTTQDWHVDPGDHFSDDPDFVDTWPPHGVAGTEEAELHPALSELYPEVTVKKGMHAAAYSGFEAVDGDGRPLAEILRDYEITAVDVVGLAESHCVKATALDAVREGLTVRVLTDLTAPVTPEQGETARSELAAAGVQLISSNDVAAEPSGQVPGGAPGKSSGKAVRESAGDA
jgi:nicotinamidase/pyrazinamidase